jgi:L-aminopeptidase/D-esterase-like protein
MYYLRIFAGVALVWLLCEPTPLPAQSGNVHHAAEPRARDIGIPFDGTTGPFNAITDVTGVEVGYKTLISGEGKLIIGKGPVRTGVTAILPRGKDGKSGVFAGFFSGNGNGDMTGTHWIEESGVLETPILITNTNSVGVVRDAAIAWLVQRNQPGDFWYPVVAETADWLLNDIKGQHVTAQDALDALNSAAGGPIQEGNVGGGTGMICNGFKGGTGTSSRILDASKRWLHRWRARAMQLRTTTAIENRRHSRGTGNECSAKAMRTKAIEPANPRL